jgi:rhamnogalacturonyl hydrolase YesR
MKQSYTYYIQAHVKNITQAFSPFNFPLSAFSQIRFTVSSLCFALVFTVSLFGQEKEPANDFNTPLHLLQPSYRNPYGILSPDSVKKTLDRILSYLEKETPAQVIDTRNGKQVALVDINSYSGLQRGAFRLASYEWGVTYAGMLLAGETTRDKKFTDYTLMRLRFLCETTPYFRKQMEQNNLSEPQLRQLISPQALDDAGSMCVAFIKTALQKQSSQYDGIIRNYMQWIMHGQLRLDDGTLARNRPHYHTLWLDDMFMAIPALAWMGKYSGDTAYFDEAVKQIRLFTSRMFVPGKNLFMHGWIENSHEHPAFFWGRANGWAVMTLVEVLEVFPEKHPGYDEIMGLLKKHIQGLAVLQSGDGRWHQLLDRNDSYLETSATAIYTYVLARAINRGWIDAKAYGPCALLAWNTVSKQVNEKGQVEGVCVGTGMAFDPAYYYYRPVNVYAAHGYGPVLLAGAEIIALLKQKHPKMNDSAVQFYDKEVQTDKPIFEEK